MSDSLLPLYIQEGVIKNRRNDLYIEEGDTQRINKRKISGYLRNLEERGDYFKIKHIKKLYQIYTIFNQMKSLIFDDDTFDFNLKISSIKDFSYFLLFIIDRTRVDIIKFIDILQDDNFNNNKLIRKNLDKYNNRIFCLYLDALIYCQSYITN